MNTDETISVFTSFFRDRGHQPVDSSSLLAPPGDPVLFTSAGMHPLTPYLTGQPHPLSLADLPVDLVQHTADRFGQVIGPSRVTDVLAGEERKFRELVSRGRSLLRRLYPSGRLTEEDYEFLRDTYGLPRELITDLLGRA